jgi:membrane associated rhomboid family serine protease
MANTVTLILLGGTVVIFYPKQFLKLSIYIIIIGGAGVWLIGRDACHVGSSGLLFGYFGFLISRGVYERTFSAIILSLMVIIIYGGMIYGILPLSPYISWEAHLCGFLAGVVAARIPGKK